MKHEYQSLLDGIRAPQGLQSRVLDAAGERQRVEKQPRKQVWRAAACAACALALALGGIRLGMEKAMEYSVYRVENSMILKEYRSVTACAAERGANGGVYLPAAENPQLEALAGAGMSEDEIAEIMEKRMKAAKQQGAGDNQPTKVNPKTKSINDRARELGGNLGV